MTAIRLFFLAAVLIAIRLPAASAQETVLAIENITLIDGTGRPPVANTTIVVEGDRILEVGTDDIQIPRGARRIDGRGKYVIPGLIDGHIHLQGADAPDDALALRLLEGYLYCGVTSVYDAGNPADFIFPLRERERSGAIISPRIFAAGPPITNLGGHGGDMALTIEDWEVDRAKLDALFARKPDMIKITRDERGWGPRPMIDSMPIDLVQTIFRYANEHGIRTTIHVSSELHVWQVIYAGADTLAHPVIQAPVSERYLNLVRVKRIPLSSTLTVGDSHARLAEASDFLDQPLYRATLDPNEIMRLKTEESKKRAGSLWTGWMKVMNPVAQDNLRRVNEVGGVVALGTDRSNGADTHRELELLVGGGISPDDAISIGTLNAAKYIGMEKELGTIEAGKLADLVILDADPTADINNVKRIHMVIKNGSLIDRSRLNIPANANGTQ